MRCLNSFFMIIFLISITHSQTLESISFPFLGQVQPRHASEIQASNWSVGAETMDRGFTVYENWKSYLGPLGVKKARLQSGWAKTESQQGIYDFSWLDPIVTDMVDQSVEPWMCLCYGNPVYEQGGTPYPGSDLPLSDEAKAAWLDYVRQVVMRYRQVIDEWEIWNEPNHNRHMIPALDYAEFLLETARTIRSLQPDAKILGLSLCFIGTEMTMTWIHDVMGYLKNHDALHYVDEITYHPYSNNPDANYHIVKDYKELFAGYAPHIRLRQGENGCPSEKSTKALGNYDWTRLTQSKWALRRMLGDLGRDIESSYFAIMDMNYRDGINRKGLLRATEDQKVEEVKPAYKAVQNLTAVFDERLQRIDDYSYTTDLQKSHSLFAYQNRFFGKQVITIWLDGETPSNDNSLIRSDFTFYGCEMPDPVWVDLRTGEVYEIPEKNWSRKGLVYTFKDIPVYDSPILIADKSLVLILIKSKNYKN